MQSGLNLSTLTDDCPRKTSRVDLTCRGCGRTFQKPIFASVSSSGEVRRYSACPHCMTRVDDADVTEVEERRSSASVGQARNLGAPSEDYAKCEHVFGYLKKRHKGEPIPERCLTCTKMVECLYG